MPRYPQQPLEVPETPVAVLAMDTIGHLPTWALTAMFLYTSYVFTVPMKEKSPENVVQAYLSKYERIHG